MCVYTVHLALFFGLITQDNTIYCRYLVLYMCFVRHNLYSNKYKAKCKQFIVLYTD